MAMCKKCGNIVSPMDIMDGVCKTCLGGEEGFEKAKVEAQIPKGNPVDDADYEDRMLEAYVGKADKYNWYKTSFAKFNINGVPAMKWNWSWWGFFGNLWFLIYRKAYLAALVLLIASVTLGLIPIVGLIIYILAGGYSTYFIYKKYLVMKEEIERTVENPAKRVETMATLGGFNPWVIWLSIISTVIIVVGIMAAVIIPKMAGAGY